MTQSVARERFQQLAKLALGLALVAYVLRSRMIDFGALRDVLLLPQNAAFSFSFLLFASLSSSFRWFLLARAQGLSLEYLQTFQLSMIGMFFNTFMPGAVGGDLVKAWYVAGREPQRKTKAVFTVVLDRVVGLSVFFFFAAGALVCFYPWLPAHPELKALAYGIWAFTGASALFVSVLFVSLIFKLPGSRLIRRVLSRSPKIYQLFESVVLYRHHAGTVFLALLISAVSILGNVLLFKFLGDSLGIPLSLSHYFFVVPIGLTVSAAPLLPGGIGVGQVAFFTLFSWVGLQNPEQGATLCTLVQVYTILFNCLGAIFYIRFRRSPAMAESLQT